MKINKDVNENQIAIATKWKRYAKYALCALLTIVLSITSFRNVDAHRYIMTYLYGSGNYISMTNSTNNVLNEISPSYFDIDANGNLILNAVDEELVNTMHEDDIKVVPFLSNHWDKAIGRKALSNREKLSTDIVNAIVKYNLDGVNVDIENVTEVDRDEYIDLVRLLRNKLPKEKSVVVSVVANPHNWTTGWHGSYDYSTLAKYADYLMIMAYDEHYEGGEAGPVSSIDFVENSIKYALERVDRNKIVLGIPLYGRYWKEDGSYKGLAISLEKIEELIKNYESKVTYDEETKSVKAVIRIRSTDKKPKIYGKTLTAGKYIIWYENEDSIKEKLELVNKYDIKGTGTWRLGLENKSLWDIFKEYLLGNDSNNDNNNNNNNNNNNDDSNNDNNNNEVDTNNRIFSDVTEEHWGYNAIIFLKEKGWITGKGNQIYDPDGALTRAEISTIICKMLNLDTADTGNVSKYYTDVEGHWAESYIMAMTELGIVEGFGNQIFKPDNKVTRAQVTKIISKVAALENSEISNEKVRTYENFKDVDSKHWAYSYIKELYEKDIIDGYEDGTFRVNKNITRAEIAQIIYKGLDR